MSEFLRPSAATDKIANESVSFEGLREAMKSELEKQGVIVRGPLEDGGWGAQLGPGYHAEPAVEVSLPEASRPQNCVRVIYPHLNDRFEIFGASEQELDLKEAQIRSLYRG
jgi:hypothetical protein